MKPDSVHYHHALPCTALFSFPDLFWGLQLRRCKKSAAPSPKFPAALALLENQVHVNFPASLCEEGYSWQLRPRTDSHLVAELSAPARKPRSCQRKNQDAVAANLLAPHLEFFFCGLFNFQIKAYVNPDLSSNFPIFPSSLPQPQWVDQLCSNSTLPSPA
jgi:hypothetical protein